MGLAAMEAVLAVSRSRLHAEFKQQNRAGEYRAIMLLSVVVDLDGVPWFHLQCDCCFFEAHCTTTHKITGQPLGPS